MIVTRTPLRISLFGGGSDFPEYIAHAPGAVISFSINKYMYIMLNKRYDDSIRVAYSITEIVNDIDDLKHDIARECLKLFTLSGMEVCSLGDIPSSGIGLGSSSAYCVGLLNALYNHYNIEASNDKLAYKACMVELDILGKPIGIQDQFSCAIGGLKYLRFYTPGRVGVNLFDSEELINKIEENILVLNTGMSRGSDSILREQSNNTKKNYAYLERMVAITDTMYKEMSDGNVSNVGDALNECWLLKKQLSSGISNPRIDELYNKALLSGATGGKLSGAGGGGFLVLWVPKENQEKVIRELGGLQKLDVKIDRKGTTVLYKGG
jgi:D-glycero-alpha-D-manno-heptose-7-phosphate kinase